VILHAALGVCLRSVVCLQSFSFISSHVQVPVLSGSPLLYNASEAVAAAEKVHLGPSLC